MEKHDEFLLNLLDDIDEHGWIVLGVVDDNGFSFSYTVGLTNVNKPELYISGLHPQQALFILNDVARQMVDGKSLCDGEEIEGVLKDGFTLKVRGPIDPEVAEMNQARSVYLDVRGVQLLWQDRYKRFPEDDGYDIESCQQNIMPYWCGV